MKVKLLYFCLCFLISFGCTAQESKKKESLNIKLKTTISLKPYDTLLSSIVIQKDMIKKKYFSTESQNGKDSILLATSDYLVIFLSDSLFPYWYGTPWDFNGTTQIPNTGEIACGYFVSTLLKHAGFNLERVRLAQQASELIIKSLTSEKFIKRFSNVTIDRFVDAIELMGDGLYVVGLDIHTGFILNNDKGVFFIHSSFEPPLCVVREIALESNILSNSRYRIVGKISADYKLMEKWIKNSKIKTRIQ